MERTITGDPVRSSALGSEGTSRTVTGGISHVLTQRDGEPVKSRVFFLRLWKLIIEIGWR